MLGSRAEAEDVLQDAWLRVADTTERIDAPRAYLTTVVTRLCLDALGSARVRRERYVGPWLPEPLVAIATDAPEAPLERAESIHLAFLVLLERLSPLERAAFLLREVFELPYTEVARALDAREPACRQLVARARAHVDAGRARFVVAEARERSLFAAFLGACAQGDEAALTALLAEDVRLASDGGGRTRAALRPIEGRENVARFLLGLARKHPSAPVWPARVNGAPGLVFEAGEDAFVLTLSVGERGVNDVWIVSNPEKLTALRAQLRALGASRSPGS
jgi:RNA polymerase sigma-70 factor (ECF subfamily)